MNEKLTNEDVARYQRHIVLKGMGASGQQKLKHTSVLIVGAGGLGSPVIAYLAAAGIGRITIIDDDHVDLSNLQRQIVHGETDIEKPKALSGAAFAHEQNSQISINGIEARLTQDNGAKILDGHDIVVDGTDLFSSRKTIAQLCQKHKIPLVSGAVSMFDGQLSVFSPHLTNEFGALNPSFSCLYPDTPNDNDLPACETNGILGATTGVIGTLMAMEVIKLATGIGQPLIGRLLLYDGRDAKFTELKYARLT